MKKIVFLPIFALIIGLVLLPCKVEGQVTFEALGSMGPGDVVNRALNFATGGEIYVYTLTLSVDCTVGSGNLGIFHTLGSVADTEIALYGSNGYTLASGNDDGETGFWGDPGYDSLMYFGTNRVGSNDPYQGLTQQGNTVPWPTDLVAGDYVLIVGTYNTTWDEADARLTDFGGSDVGAASLTIMVR